MMQAAKHWSECGHCYPEKYDKVNQFPIEECPCKCHVSPTPDCMNTGKWIKRPQNEQDMLQKQCKCSVKDIAHMLYCPLSPTPDSVEEQDEIQEDTTSMEEKLEALDFLSEGAKSIDPTDSWEKEFDAKFPPEGRPTVEWDIAARRMKQFISEVRQKAKKEVLREVREMYRYPFNNDGFTCEQAMGYITEYAKSKGIEL